MFSGCDTVDDDEAGVATAAAAAGCAVPLAGLGGTAVWKLSFPDRSPTSSKDTKAQATSAATAMTPAHAQRSRPGSIDVEGFRLENQFSKRRPMSQVRCEFSAGHRTGGINAEARWPPLDPELVRRATGTTGGFSCARRTDGNGASKSLASWIGELTIGPVLSRSMVTDATEWLRAAYPSEKKLPLCLARPPSCSPPTRRGASPPTSLSCRSCSAKRSDTITCPRTFSIARGCRQGPQLARSVAPLREPS